MSTTLTIKCDESGNKFTAETFIDYIRPSHDHWHEKISTTYSDGSVVYPMYSSESQWIFRGHADADNWKLTPSAWRSTDEMLKYVDRELKWVEQNDGGTNSKGNTWRNTEASLLRAFVDGLREFGYPIPEINTSFDFFGMLGDIDNACSEIIALAQHHGVPTRFLDWTFDPLSAAYFASRGDEMQDKDVCIWALNSISPIVLNSGIKIRKQLRHKNKFLAAQNGLFTELVSINLIEEFDKNHEWPALEDVLHTNIQPQNIDGEKNTLKPVLQKIILEADQVNDLRVCLDREKYSRSHLMPTLDNLAADVLEKWINTNNSRVYQPI